MNCISQNYIISTVDSITDTLIFSRSNVEYCVIDEG